MTILDLVVTLKRIYVDEARLNAQIEIKDYKRRQKKTKANKRKQNKTKQKEIYSKVLKAAYCITTT